MIYYLNYSNIPPLFFPFSLSIEKSATIVVPGWISDDAVLPSTINERTIWWAAFLTYKVEDNFRICINK